MSETNKFELTPSLSIIIAGIIIAGAIMYTNGSNAAGTGAGNEAALGAAANVPAPTAEDHWVGSRDASTVLVEYSDIQCYYCGLAHPTLTRLVEESNGAIAWVHRHLPLESIHPEARPAAIASECVNEQLGNDAFWSFINTMFADQSKMNSAYYLQVAKQLGVNEAQYQSCVATEKYASKVDTEANDAFASGANGTPYTVVFKNGKQVGVSGALPYDQFKEVIDGIR